MAVVEAPGGAGAAVAGAGCGGRVRATGEAGGPVGPVGGGGGGHGAAVVCLAALGERERWWRGLGLGAGYGRRGEQEAWSGLWGEGLVDMGRRRRRWWRLGERERRGWGPGGPWWRLGERERRQ